MSYHIIPFAFILALLLTFMFSSLPGRGAWRPMFIFFFIIFLVNWAAQLWITPFGPTIWDVSFLPLLFVAVIFSFLILALLPHPKAPAKSDPETTEQAAVFTVGMFFWFFIILLLTSIAIGYYRMIPVDNIK